MIQERPPPAQLQVDPAVRIPIGVHELETEVMMCSLPGGVTYPYRLDSGADRSYIPFSIVEEVYQTGQEVIVTNLVQPFEVDLAISQAETTLVSRSCELELSLHTVAGPVVLQNCELMIIETEMSTMLVGNDVLMSLGLDLEAQFANLATSPRMDVDEDLPDSNYVEFGAFLEEDVRVAIESCLDRTGVNASLRQSLSEIVYHSTVKDCWRVQLQADPPAKVDPVDIDLVDGAKPYRTPMRRYSTEALEFMQQHVEVLLENNLVFRNAASAWAAPVLIVKKPRGGYRFTVDLRIVNSQTEKTAWPMPVVDVALHNLAGSKRYAVLDAFNGYWQWPAGRNRDAHSFMTPFGIFTPNRLIQGSCNGVAAFQAGMQRILGDLVYNGVLIWIDDLLLYSDSDEGLLHLLKRVLQRLNDAGIKLHPNKCLLYQTEVVWCGRVISETGVRFAPEKVQALMAMPLPKTVLDLQQFLWGMTWLKGSIMRYSTVTTPLVAFVNECMKRTNTSGRKSTSKMKKLLLTSCGWDENHDKQFLDAKSAVQSTTETAHPDDSKDFCLFSDASSTHWSAVLTQIPAGERALDFHDQAHEPLAFLGGRFTGAQLRWPIVEKEAYAIICACERLDYLLLRSKGFLIFTDHRNLMYIFAPATVSVVHRHVADRLQRWALRLMAYTYVIVHIPGELNV